MLKAGDKILCINDNVNAYFKKGNIYTIIDVDSRYYYIDTKDNSHWGFSIEFESFYPGDHFDKYFISIKELRKQKLNKLEYEN